MIVEIKFDDWGRAVHFDAQSLEVGDSDKVVVETEAGLAFGTVKVSLLPLPPEEEAGKLKKVVRKATEEDLMQDARNREKATDAFHLCREKIEESRLNMTLVNAEYLFDGSKAIFYYTAEERVDFRELVKNLASRLHTRIEMRQIGVRDAAKRKGGIGPCGRVLCCTGWINEFAPVSVKMAKVQGLSLNPTNISGMCGRLMCCLSYEHQNYVDGIMKAQSNNRPPQPAEGRKWVDADAGTAGAGEAKAPAGNREDRGRDRGRGRERERGRENRPRREETPDRKAEQKVEQKVEQKTEAKSAPEGTEEQRRKRSRGRRRRKKPAGGN